MPEAGYTKTAKAECALEECGLPEAAVTALMDHEPWPLDIFRQNAARPPQAGKKRCVILTTGAMNPPHRGHAALLHQARERLEAGGYEVLAGWMSPSHDDYVGSKAARLGTRFFTAGVRLMIGSSVLSGDKFLSLGAWEAQFDGRWPDFPEVTENLQEFLGSLPEADSGLRGDSSRVRVFYACGTDHADRCGLYRGVGLGPRGDMGVVVVPRAGETPRGEDPKKLLFVASPAAGEVATFSSTKVRDAILESNTRYLRTAVSPEAAQLISHPTPCQLEAYPELELSAQCGSSNIRK